MSKAVDIPYKTRKKESSLPLEKKVKVDGNMSEAFNWLPSDIFDTLSQNLLEQRTVTESADFGFIPLLLLPQGP